MVCSCIHCVYYSRFTDGKIKHNLWKQTLIIANQIDNHDDFFPFTHKDPATIVDITNKVMEDEGGTAFFECVVDAKPVVPDMITWTRQDFDMSKTKQRTEGSKSYLTVYELTRQDTGNFKCVADNGIGRPDSKNARLIVKCE